jgi:hypothetical protein
MISFEAIEAFATNGAFPVLQNAQSETLQTSCEPAH